MAVNHIVASDPVLKSIPVSNFLVYLERMGWTTVNHPNDRIYLFQGPSDDEGQALQLIIPRDHNLEDANSRLAEAVSLLAVVHRVPLDYVIESIRADNEDVSRVNRVILEPKAAPLWLRLSTNPVFSVVLAVFLVFAVSMLLVSYTYTNKNQSELQRIRADKVTEVWSDLDLYEATVVELLQKIDVKSSSGLDGQVSIPDLNNLASLKKTLEQSDNLHEEILDSLAKNRIWLGEDAYHRIKNYVDDTFGYYFDSRRGPVNTQAEEKRNQARIELDKLRVRTLKG
jgi:hypothetical protein